VIPPPLRSLEEKHLIQNQMFGSRQTAGQTPPPKSVPIYISWYINDYGRPWTPLDVNPRIRHVHGQIAGTGGVLLMTTDQKVSYSSPSGALVTALSVPTMPRRVPNRVSGDPDRPVRRSLLAPSGNVGQVEEGIF
jgi:hypothetical protein